MIYKSKKQIQALESENKALKKQIEAFKSKNDGKALNSIVKSVEGFKINSTKELLESLSDDDFNSLVAYEKQVRDDKRDRKDSFYQSLSTTSKIKKNR